MRLPPRPQLRFGATAKGCERGGRALLVAAFIDARRAGPWPLPEGAQLASVIKERVGLFQAGVWDPLFNEHLQFRDPSAHR